MTLRALISKLAAVRWCADLGRWSGLVHDLLDQLSGVH